MGFMRPDNLYQTLILGLLVLLLGACGSTGFRAEVSRFHQLPAPSGEAAAIVPAQDIVEGIEFNAYANQVGARLDALGYRAAAGEPPDLIVTLGYGATADPGYRPRSGPTIGFGIGGYGSHVGGGVSTAVNLSGRDRVYYLHYISLVITEAETGTRLYEGSAQGYAEGSQLPELMPVLIEALFQDWPGPSGATTTVKFDRQ